MAEARTKVKKRRAPKRAPRRQPPQRPGFDRTPVEARPPRPVRRRADAARAPIIPPRSVARRALLSLVAIMSFLACVTAGAVAIVGGKAVDWQRQIAEEVTIQLSPIAGDDMEQLLERAAQLAVQTPGVTRVRVLDADTAAALLEPWLGTDFDRSELPLPRLVTLDIDAGADLNGLRARLAADVPGASLDDHGIWLAKLARMSRVTVLAGVAVLGLVLAATALSVVFATRGAMAGNRDVIEVLHLVGAEDTYIAREFQRHFLVLGLKGAGLGGLVALVVFAIASFAAGTAPVTDEVAQLQSLFGGFSVGALGYAGVAFIILVVAVLIAITARATVRSTLRALG